MANKRVRTNPRYLEFTALAGGQSYTVNGDGVVIDETLAPTLVAAGTALGVGTVVTDSPAAVTPPDSPLTPEQLATVAATLSATLAPLIAAAIEAGLPAAVEEYLAFGERIALLIQQGEDEQAAALAASIGLYGSASNFRDDFADLTAWVQPATPGLTVSGGKAFSGGTGNARGANHAWEIPMGTEARAVFIVNVPSTATDVLAVVGVSDDAIGAIPASGAANARGISIAHTNWIRKWDQGTITSFTPTTTFTPGVPVVVVVTVDDAFLSVVARQAGNDLEYRTQWPRAGYSINNLFMFISDARTTAGISIGPVVARKAIVTPTVRTGVEGITRTTHWSGTGTSSGSGEAFKIQLPPSYNSTVASPVMFHFHGASGSEHNITDNANTRTVGDAFLAAGYIVVSACHNSWKNSWGNQLSLDAYVAAYETLKANYAIGPVVLVGESMGGIESLLTLAQDNIPGVVAWLGLVPSYDLAYQFTMPAWESTIRANYGIALDGSDFAEKTAGHNPAVMNPRQFRKVPMWMLVGTGDTQVPEDPNGRQLALDVAGVAPVTKIEGSGGHGISYAAHTAAMVAFANSHIA